MSDCNCPDINNCDCGPTALDCAPVTDNCSGVPPLSFAKPTSEDKYVPPAQCLGTLDYSTSACADSEATYVAGLMAESLNAAAGPINLFPLLGVHNQGSTIDLAKNGYPLSSGASAGSSIADAFNVNPESWLSVQIGASV